MPDETRKPDQTNKSNTDKAKVDELAPKEISERDAQSVKGGMAGQKFDKK